MNERIADQNHRLHEEIADLDEQIAEKARAPLSKKRQSNERLIQAKETF